MKNIYTWAAKPAKRTLTVGDLKSADLRSPTVKVRFAGLAAQV